MSVDDLHVLHSLFLYFAQNDVCWWSIHFALRISLLWIKSCLNRKKARLGPPLFILPASRKCTFTPLWKKIHLWWSLYLWKRVTFGGVFIPCIYSHARWSYRRRFRSLRLCPLSVERYYFPLFGDTSRHSLTYESETKWHGVWMTAKLWTTSLLGHTSFTCPYTIQNQKCLFFFKACMTAKHTTRER